MGTKAKQRAKGGILGVPEPRIYKGNELDAYSAQAYFYLYWVYRGILWLGIVSALVTTGLVVLALLVPSEVTLTLAAAAFWVFVMSFLAAWRGRAFAPSQVVEIHVDPAEVSR